MNKLIVVLFVLSCLFFTTCKKINYKTTSVKGVLWDYCGERPMPGLKVALLEGTYKGSGYSIRTIKELTTNTDGTFDFGEFDADKREHKHFYKVVYIATDADYTSRGLGESQGVKNISEWKVIPNTINNDTLRICGKFDRITMVSPPPPYNGIDTNNYKININFVTKYHVLNGSIDLRFVKDDGYVSTGLLDAGLYTITTIRNKNNIITTTIEQKYFARGDKVTYVVEL
ncbi:MAG: hypothetical protein V4667_13590 [Bacteroidota bacterium]